METQKKTNQDQGQQPEPKKSWLELNLWLVAVGIAIFLLRMCRELSK